MIDVAFIGVRAKVIPHRTSQVASALPDQPLPPHTALISRHQGSASPNLLESPFAQPRQAMVATVQTKHLIKYLETFHTPAHDAIGQR